jgi:predicted metal-binding membrane protein
VESTQVCQVLQRIGLRSVVVPGARNAWARSRLGVHCSLCCFGFMMILLVTGVMRLSTMAIVAAAITVERA